MAKGSHGSIVFSGCPVIRVREQCFGMSWKDIGAVFFCLRYDNTAFSDIYEQILANELDFEAGDEEITCLYKR